MIDRRPLVILAVFIAVLAAFVGIHAASGEPKTSGPTTTSVPTTAAPTTAAPSGLRTEWQPALTHINATENALFRDPDPTKVDTIMEPGCACSSLTKSRLTTLQQRGWRIAGDNLVITSSYVTKVDGPDQVEVFVSLSIPGFPVVDDLGTTVQGGSSPKNGALLYILHRGTDNLWRILDRRSVNG